VIGCFKSASAPPPPLTFVFINGNTRYTLSLKEGRELDWLIFSNLNMRRKIKRQKSDYKKFRDIHFIFFLI